MYRPKCQLVVKEENENERELSVVGLLVVQGVGGGGRRVTHRKYDRQRAVGARCQFPGGGY